MTGSQKLVKVKQREPGFVIGTVAGECYTVAQSLLNRFEKRSVNNTELHGALIVEFECVIDVFVEFDRNPGDFLIMGAGMLGDNAQQR